jgi:hypothetical protein
MQLKLLRTSLPCFAYRLGGLNDQTEGTDPGQNPGKDVRDRPAVSILLVPEQLESPLYQQRGFFSHVLTC